MTLKSSNIVAALKAADKAGVDTSDALDELSTLVEQTGEVTTRRALTSIKTEIGTRADGSPLVVGWDVCHGCKLHVSVCKCQGGPKCPPHIVGWVLEEQRRREGTLPTAVRSTEIAEKGLSPEGVPGSGDTGNGPVQESPTAVRLATGPACAECGTSVSEDNADQNDDESWTCFECQEKGTTA